MGTIYVAKSGDDGNSGSTQSSPKLTIAAAVAAATNNRDIVEIIDEGTYAESQIVVAADGITLTHTGSGRPIIDASGLGSKLLALRLMVLQTVQILFSMA